MNKVQKISKGMAAAALLMLGCFPALSAQCGAGPWVNLGTITPTTNWQVVPAITGGQYVRFYATAGIPYSFSFCLGGGAFDEVNSDPQITIQTDLGVPVGPAGFADDACGGTGLGSHMTAWIPSSTGWYRALITEYNCIAGSFVNTLAYKQDLPLGGGSSCASPHIISSLPFSLNGASTCGRGDFVPSTLAPNSPYMDGEDMIFRYAGTAGQCISILLSNGYADMGVFLYNGCPGAGGTYLTSATDPLGAPQIANFSLPSTSTYYIVVSNMPGWYCSYFDIDVVACPPPVTGSVCGNAYNIPSLPFERLGYTTCGYNNDYSNGIAPCGTPYTTGQDYVFSYTVSSPQCIDIVLSHTMSWAGIIVTKGCPGTAGATCVEVAENAASGNPFARYVNLATPGTYYIIIDTWSPPACTPFDIYITPCAPACTINPAASDVCGSATNLGGPIDSVCGVTHPDPVYNAESPGNLGSNFCGSIENNSWYRFTATQTTMNFNVQVSNCAQQLGIQAQIFSTPNCTNFTPVSTCYNPGGPWNGVMSASGLTIGGTYYLMVDGFAGDECDYLITVSNLLPVEASDLMAETDGADVVLNWTTFIETQNRGFYIQRGEWFDSPERISVKWEDVGFVEGHGTTGTPYAYSFTDHPQWQSGKYYYRLRQVDLNGTSAFSNIVEIVPGTPDNSALLNVFPNPVNDILNVEFLHMGEGKVGFELYDFTGHQVAQWQLGEEAGIFTEQLPLTQLADGVYLLTFRSGNMSDTRRITVAH